MTDLSIERLLSSHEASSAVVADRQGRPIVRVLLSLDPPDGTTRYVSQITDGVPSEVKLSYFSWVKALFGRYDIFHVHWPEYLARGKSWPIGLARSALFTLLLARLWLFRVPIVRTVHNISPHENSGGLERRLLRWCERQTILFIRLNEATALATPKSIVTILHGHYKDRFRHHSLPNRVPGRLLYFGLIRPYKGVEELISTFSKMASDSLTLRIVGKPLQGLGKNVAEACQLDPRISARLEFVEDAVLVQEIGQAELVVLPYREMHNSGALLVALSLGRPVLAPSSASNQLISREVGDQWLLTYDGELTDKILNDALAKARLVPPDASPNLAGRDWKVIGEAHYQAYLRATAATSGMPI